MDLKDTLIRLSENITKMKDSLQTEEATKNAFIMPMIAALGYDVFNPFEVIPEMDCDLVHKKGEKIDYAIVKDGQPIILIECKHCNQNLDLHSTQLQKYFVASNARFAILTNGIEYRFYTDLEKKNIMDERPFLVVDMLDLSDADVEQIKKFHKSYYNELDILSTANELKYTTELKSIMSREFSSPSPEFVKFFARQAYTSGQITSKVVDAFTPLVKKSIATIINDIISDRLNTAIKNEQQDNQQQNSSDVADDDSDKLPEGVVFIDKETGITTTQEEIDAYNIIRSIMRKYIDANKIVYADFKSYFAIGIENASNWWFCRLSFGVRKKSIYLPTDKYKDSVKIDIESIDDLFRYSDKLEEAFNIALLAYERWKGKKNA